LSLLKPQQQQQQAPAQPPASSAALSSIVATLLGGGGSSAPVSSTPSYATQPSAATPAYSSYHQYGTDTNGYNNYDQVSCFCVCLTLVIFFSLAEIQLSAAATSFLL